MTDKMPTNIWVGRDKETYYHKAYITGAKLPDDVQYTLVHNNPNYHVIPKADVDGDVMGALDEVLVDVKGYDGKYQVSNLGNVRNGNGKIKPSVQNGYLRANLSKPHRKGKQYLIHRLVAEHFIGEIPDNYCVAHLDGTRDNNRVDNLKICTYAENESHKKIHGTCYEGEDHPNSSLTAYQVMALRELYPLVNKEKTKDFYNCFDVEPDAVRRSIYKKSYKNVPSLQQALIAQSDVGEPTTIKPQSSEGDVEEFTGNPDAYYDADSLTANQRKIYNEIIPHALLAAKTWTREDKQYTASKIGANRAIIKLIKSGYLSQHLKTPDENVQPTGESQKG